jgi:hypothetical protein
MAPTANQLAALEAEHLALQRAARERRSVDLFARAGVVGFCWAILAGVLGKLLWDSARTPGFFWPLVVLDLALLADTLRCYLAARAALQREVTLLERLRAVRIHLGIDEAGAEALPLTGAAGATGAAGPGTRGSP